MFRHFLLLAFFMVYSGSAMDKEPIAVSDLDGNILQTDLMGLSNKLRSILSELGSFAVVERSRMADILKEQGFQNSGCTNAECAVEMGQLLNVKYMIIGSIDRVGNVYTINVRAVDVASGTITITANQDCRDCGIENVLLDIIPKIGKKLSGISDSTSSELIVAPTVHPNVEIKQIGKIRINTTPSKAMIYLDNKLIGRSPMTIDSVAYGSHSIFACIDSNDNKKRYLPATQSINLSEPIRDISLMLKDNRLRFSLSQNSYISMGSNYNGPSFGGQIGFVKRSYSFYLAYHTYAISDGSSLPPYWSEQYTNQGIGLIFFYDIFFIQNVMAISPGAGLGYWAVSRVVENHPTSFREKGEYYFAPRLKWQVGYKYFFIAIDAALLIGNSVSFMPGLAFELIL